MEKLKITTTAKKKAREALEYRSSLPRYKQFALTEEQAKQQGIKSGVTRAKQLIDSKYLSFDDARSVAHFYQRFKGRFGPRIEGSFGLWGGRQFGRQAVSFVKKYRARQRRMKKK